MARQGKPSHQGRTRGHVVRASDPGLGRTGRTTAARANAHDCMYELRGDLTLSEDRDCQPYHPERRASCCHCKYTGIKWCRVSAQSTWRVRVITVVQWWAAIQCVFVFVSCNFVQRLPASSGTTFVYTLVNRPYSPRKLRYGATETNVDNQAKRPSFRRTCHVNTRQPVLSPWFQSRARPDSAVVHRFAESRSWTRRRPPCAMSSCSSDLQSAAATGTTTAAPIASRTERNKKPHRHRQSRSPGARGDGRATPAVHLFCLNPGRTQRGAGANHQARSPDATIGSSARRPWKGRPSSRDGLHSSTPSYARPGRTSQQQLSEVTRVDVRPGREAQRERPGGFGWN